MQAFENEVRMSSSRNLNVLVIATSFPKPDQASGDLRFYTLLSLVTRKHVVLFCALNVDVTTKSRNEIGALLAEESGVLPHFFPFERSSEQRPNYSVNTILC